MAIDIHISLIALSNLNSDELNHLHQMINTVYEIAEEGLWKMGSERVTRDELLQFIAAKNIVVAKIKGQIVGAIMIRKILEDTAEFGMLVTSLRHRKYRYR